MSVLAFASVFMWRLICGEPMTSDTNTISIFSNFSILRSIFMPSITMSSYGYVAKKLRYFFSLIFSTFKTNSRPRFINQKIITYKFVPIDTFSFSSMNRRWTNTSKTIDSRWNSFKMFRLYARRISAKMINMETFRNLTFMNFIRQPMCRDSFFAKPRSSISKITFSSGPYPTSFSLFNFSPKPFEVYFHGV